MTDHEPITPNATAQQAKDGLSADTFNAIGNGQYRVMSKHLDFDHIANCRDLGGIATADGHHVKPGMLLRSANLHHASDQDLLALREIGVQNVVDLRTKQEREAEPDRLLSTWNIYELPSFKEMSELGAQLNGVIAHPGTFICHMYTDLLVSKQGIACWSEWLRLLVDRPGSYLFHCTQGKDRTGIAAALILAVLGVDEQTIRDEYLQTNLYMNTETPRLVKMVDKVMPMDVEADITQFLVAAPAYFDAMMQQANQYGGLLGYAQQQLGVTDDDIAFLRATYLQ
ncbi:tyrosine-protein phosphatase [Bifidobacterium gallicum]|uniref:Aldo/keto reductase family protein n=1 Tax=Bifidobacterium gallicum DSM 20093 = LMG 11596 TaxID=561180 RepID=D1NTH3_9BIFI|nr:tyrosine-protein phosphatase [Bifidobacterium gallicum]EFA23027.1 aldo/keto reductase family protein [Bifidobacterium gallicum DSM 20093 = LMG 11596]KFI57664.1 protein-tyrosine phosphatase [Bifidobacterium gallicum DSM 20093 = LMG 11596]